MPKRKPLGWPAYMREKRLQSGIGYFWELPTWARKAGCSLPNEPLGKDYATAKQRCDEVLNPLFTAWRRGDPTTQVAPVSAFGTFDWVVSIYRQSPKFTSLPLTTQRSYGEKLGIVSQHILKDGRKFGALAIRSITPAVADLLFAKIKSRDDGTERTRTAVFAMRVSQRAWGVAYRARADVIPAANPFAKMGLSYKAKPTRPFRLEELLRFVAAADAVGQPSVGTAAMIAYFWLQRQEDILTRLSWSHYRPADSPDMVRIFHHKTREIVDLPLFDTDGTTLWPELTERLDTMVRRGTLIVMRDTLDKRKKIHMPWTRFYFSKSVAAIRKIAGIDTAVKFKGLRHGGQTEGADADLSDAQLRALSGHLSPSMTLVYARTTEKQRRDGARKRLNARTKRGNLSE